MCRSDGFSQLVCEFRVQTVLFGNPIKRPVLVKSIHFYRPLDRRTFAGESKLSVRLLGDRQYPSV